MSLVFEKPERHTDWVTATHSAAKLLILSLGVTDPVSATKTAVSAYPSTKKMLTAFKGVETQEPENLAWKWLSLTLAETVAQFLSKLRKETILQSKTLDPAVQEFLTKALDLPAGTSFDGNAIESPTTHAAFSQARSQVPHLVSAVTLWVDFDSAKWTRVFDDCLVPASFKVFTTHHADMAFLTETATGPTGTALRKNIAWARHYDWINKRFFQDPVFSPDDSVKTPLSDLYIRLRSYWHEEYEVVTKEGREPEKRCKVFLNDLHETIETWLDAETNDYLRVVTGGPGSGKSSFAKAIASETALKGKRRVIFIELQRMHLTGDIYSDIGTYLHQRHRPAGVDGSPGFPDNPMDWIKTDYRPVLIIFDGLDEITHDTEQAKEITRNFILNVDKLISGQNQDGVVVHALVLGRNAACQEGIKAAALPKKTILNVAPIRTLNKGDLYRARTGLYGNAHVDLPNLPTELVRDQRLEYWNMWCSSQGLPQEAPPEAITHDTLSDLNVEPLLLHLLILSDFCGERWQEAAKNRNVVYFDILGQIHERNVSEKKPGMELSKDDFFLLMECLGLAAWRGNLRSGDKETYNEIREIHARSLKKSGVIDHTDMDSMVLQTHARKVDGARPGFEFIHKSFGEYLTARALMTLAKRSQRLLQNDDDPTGEETVATQWVQLVEGAELTPELHRFLLDEAKHITKTADPNAIKSALEDLLTWTNNNGMPATAGTFRQMETVQRCAETALLAVGSAVSLCLTQSDPNVGTLKIDWWNNSSINLLHRLKITTGGCANLALAALNLSGENFDGANLNGANLIGADIDEASLNHASLIGADLSDANLSGVTDLSHASLNHASLIRANLSEANLIEVDFSNANLSMANLIGAELSNAKLCQADFSEADLSEARLIDADLSEADLSFARLVRADFSDADLSFANLIGADLIGADLSDADLSGADLSDADLIGADLSGARLVSADLSGANLSEVDLSEANLLEAVLNDANLGGASLIKASLIRADLIGADLSDADLSEADLSGADLSDADLSGANIQSTNLDDCIFAATSSRLVDFAAAKSFPSTAVKSIFGVKQGFGLTKLPEGLDYPEFWHIAEEAKKDNKKLLGAYVAAFEDWRRTQNTS